MDIVKRQEIFKVYKELPFVDLSRAVKMSAQHLQELNLTHRGLINETDGQNLLDPLPFVVKSEEVPFLSAAVKQWGKLLSLTYQDLWGNQDLIKSGILDSQFLWSTLGLDPSFFRALPLGSDPLSLIRLDLTRTYDGFWNLISLGTEIPRGLGFAIETRIVHSRYFGSKVPHDNLIRLAPFFQGLKDLWFSASLTHRDEPSIMVWTDGPSDPLYFEPVYLSRYFGYPLVESRDLTVRSGKVFLKTLGGLRPVDVLVRMVSDQSIDPLTGNPGGFGGVAGLMQAIRDGAILVTNAPGSKILEHRALLPHYPALAQHLLGEEILLPKARMDTLPGDEDFFAQDRWEPGTTGISLFAARFSNGWEMMPGGLVQRLLPQNAFPNTFNTTKKDLWFLSDDLVPQISLLPPHEKPSEINRAAELPSRVADDLLWLGRYTERAWVDLRFLEKWWELQYEGGPENRERGADFLDKLVKALNILPEETDEEEEAWRSSRLSDTIKEINRIAGQVLDRLSLETHRILREFTFFLENGSNQPLPEILRQVNLRLAAFSGLTMESMTRSPGWRFLDMGRRLERAQLLIEGLQSFFSLEDTEENLLILLDIFDCTLTYRTRYRLSPQRGPVLDLLLLDESNPRSLAFQIESLSAHVEHLPRTSTRAYHSVEERTILDLLTRIRLADGISLVPGVLETFLEGLSQGLEHFSDALHQTYLAKIDTMEALQARVRVDGL